MSEDTSPPDTGQVTGNSPPSTSLVANTAPTINRNKNRNPRRVNTSLSTTPRDFEGATPKIGGMLALRSENGNKKVNYDNFCKKVRFNHLYGNSV